MEPCTHAHWHAAPPKWVQIEDIEGWKEHRQYQREQCTHCPETRLVRPLPIRRRYRLVQGQYTAPSQQLRALNAIRWLPIDSLITRLHLNRFEVQALLVEWAQQGWAELEEVGGDPEWHVERARLSAQQVAQHQQSKESAQMQRHQHALATLQQLVVGWSDDVMKATSIYAAEEEIIQLIERIAALLNEQERALHQERVVPVAGTTMRVGEAPHLRFVAMIRGILELLAHPRTEHERVFSARWLHDSKALQKDRETLEAFLSLEGGGTRIGIVKHTPLVLSWGIGMHAGTTTQ